MRNVDLYFRFCLRPRRPYQRDLYCFVKRDFTKETSTVLSKETSVSVFDLDLKNLLLRMNSQKPSLTMKDLLFLDLAIVALIDHLFVLWSCTLVCKFLSFFTFGPTAILDSCLLLPPFDPNGILTVHLHFFHKHLGQQGHWYVAYILLAIEMERARQIKVWSCTPTVL